MPSARSNASIKQGVHVLTNYTDVLKIITTTVKINMMVLLPGSNLPEMTPPNWFFRNAIKFSEELNLPCDNLYVNLTKKGLLTLPDHTHIHFVHRLDNLGLDLNGLAKLSIAQAVKIFELQQLVRDLEKLAVPGWMSEEFMESDRTARASDAKSRPDRSSVRRYALSRHRIRQGPVSRMSKRGDCHFRLRFILQKPTCCVV